MHELFMTTLLTVCGFLLTAISGWFVLEFREMRKSVETLNLQIAMILQRVETHEERIERLEMKI